MDTKHTSLEEDEHYGMQLFREILQKEKNLFKAATWLSEKFSYRYGPDFAGRVEIKYNLPDRVFTLNCSDGSSSVLDQDRLDELPGQLRVLRLRARRNRKESVRDRN